MSDEVAAPVEERVDPFALFSEQLRIPVRGLAFIGHIQKDIDFCGHTFTLKTLRPSEKAAAAVAVQPWRGTIAEPEMWLAAQVSMALVAVDDFDDFCPSAGPNINEFAKARLRYATDPQNGWYPPTLGFLYDQLLGLEEEALDGVRELQNLSERSRVPSQPLPDSLSERDTLGAPMDLDIQP